MKRWRREFDELLVLRSEQYFSATKQVVGRLCTCLFEINSICKCAIISLNPLQVLERVLTFLGLKAPANWRALLKKSVHVAGPRPEGGMPPMTEVATKMLRDFYAPGLLDLATAMQGEPDAAEWLTWATTQL